jgi:hypothetical protein
VKPGVRVVRGGGEERGGRENQMIRLDGPRKGGLMMPTQLGLQVVVPLLGE